LGGDDEGLVAKVRVEGGAAVHFVQIVLVEVMTVVETVDVT